MKTKEQIQKELGCLVIPSNDFNGFNAFDGEGYYHDGQEETDICVWEDMTLLEKYPYVCWYNK